MSVFPDKYVHANILGAYMRGNKKFSSHYIFLEVDDERIRISIGSH